MTAVDLPDKFLGALDTRFAVERELGRGGMGLVLLAQDKSLDRRVAIKVLPPDVAKQVGPDRFLREIRLTARLVHPNIVPLFDSGQAVGCLYYVMPFIEGETLRARLAGGPVSPAEVVRIAGDLAEALAYAHALGIVHRDLKPDNVFWYGGRALLADFGIATTTDRLDGMRTGTGIIGTVSYMSPEQATGAHEMDGRSDLYSLGCVMFELLTGRPPFEGKPLPVLYAHAMTSPPTVISLRPDVDPELSRLVERLMAKQPSDRPPTAAAVIQALRAEPEAAHVPTADGRTTGPAGGGALPQGVRELVEQANSLFARAMQGGEGARPKLEMARVYLEKARTLAPDNPYVLVALGDVTHVRGVRGYADFSEASEEAIALWMRALAIDDSIGEVHASLGVSFLYWQDDFETAGIELKRGVELAPRHAPARRYYGAWLKIAGRPAEALEHMRMARDLEPHAAFMHVGLADVLMALGRYGQAVEPLREALRLQPRYEAALERLEMSCHRAGRQEEALGARRTLLGTRGNQDRIALLDRDVAEVGWVEARDRDLRRDLEVLLAAAERQDPFVDPGTSRQPSDKIIIVLAELGEWSRAMDWVERGYHRRPGRLRRVLTDLPFDYHGLASDPRFVPLLRTAGLGDLLIWDSRFERLDALLTRLQNEQAPRSE
jgi:tetratricopeptide (TPR) repeat protein